MKIPLIIINKLAKTKMSAEENLWKTIKFWENVISFSPAVINGKIHLKQLPSLFIVF